MDEITGRGSPSDPEMPTAVPPPTPMPPPPGGAALTPSPGPLAGFWSAGWRQALLGSLVVGVVLIVVGELIVFLVDWSSSGTLAVATLARYGLWAPLAFQHVGAQADVGGVSIPGGLGGLGGLTGQAAPGGTLATGSLSVSVSFAFAVTACTLLAMWLLARAGRAIGKAAGGPGWVRGLHGMKVALPWAVICVIIAIADRFSIRVPPNPVVQHAVSIHLSYLGAVVWPLVFGLVMGFAGGFRSAGAEAWAFGGAWGRRVRGAVAGGVWMIAAGLIASFAGLLVMAAVKPHATTSYFHAVFSTGAGDGTLLLFLNVLVLPNMAAWVLSAAMGGCLGAWGSGVGVCAISYAHFPASGLSISAGGAAAGLFGVPYAFPQLPAAPAGYFAFLLVPLVAVLAGGAIAARRSGAGSPAEAAGVGALAGVVFALISVAAVFLTAITLGATVSVGFTESATVQVGADLAGTLLMALLWGIVGGAVGGVAMGRRSTPEPAAGARPGGAWQSAGGSGLAGAERPPAPPGQSVQRPAPPGNAPPAEPHSPPGGPEPSAG